MEPVKRARVEDGAPAAAAAPRRPRIALIHGGCSNPFIFRKQLKHLLAALGETVELVDVQGGLLSKEVRFDERGLKNMALLHKVFGEDQVLREHAVTKYDSASEERYPPLGAFMYDRLEEGVAQLEEQLRQLEEPVDVLLGFSQGANMATILASRAARGEAGAPPPFRGLVLLENDPPGWPAQLPALFSSKVPLPALLVGGALESPKTDAVGELFAEPEHTRHAEGHRPLPKDAEACAEIVGQIQAFISRVTSDSGPAAASGQ